MLARCRNTRNPAYTHYGARGIDVEEFLVNTSNFVDWALSSGYKEGLSIERIDNNRGYSRDNLKWATIKEQSRNKRNTIRVSWKDTEICFADFVSEYTYLSFSYARRLYSEGKSLEELTKVVPQNKGRRAQSVRLGKLRPNESVYGRIIDIT